MSVDKMQVLAFDPKSAERGIVFNISGKLTEYTLKDLENVAYVITVRAISMVGSGEGKLTGECSESKDVCCTRCRYDGRMN